MIEEILLQAVPALLAITLHEAAHGYVAKTFGDRTAETLGRITLNPLRHIDPVGTIALPLFLLLTSQLLGGPGFLFGWAKPVPVNFANLRHPKRDMIWVAAAGPGSNLLMAMGWTVLLALAAGDGVLSSPLLALVARYGIVWNVALMVLNLLPVLPLDGGRILAGLLPHRAATAFSRLEPYGLLIIVVLLASGVLWTLLEPVRDLVEAGLFLLLQAVS
jgi:Zn-dependent protease